VRDDEWRSINTSHRLTLSLLAGCDCPGTAGPRERCEGPGPPSGAFAVLERPRRPQSAHQHDQGLTLVPRGCDRAGRGRLPACDTHCPRSPIRTHALAPTIDELTMRLHHTQHRGGHVARLNAALEGSERADCSLEELLGDLERARTCGYPPAPPDARPAEPRSTRDQECERPRRANPGPSRFPRSSMTRVFTTSGGDGVSQRRPSLLWRPWSRR
jgi:Iron/manganese superoxide dismutases, alpha-hairpin domain